MNLESLVDYAIENEKEVYLGDTTFYVIRHKKTKEPYYFAYNTEFVLYPTKDGYNIMVRDPDGLIIIPDATVAERLREIDVPIYKRNTLKLLNYLGVENIGLPGAFGKVVDYLISHGVKIKKFVPFTEKIYRKLHRLYDEIEMVKELSKKGINKRRIVDKLYDAFIEEGISPSDFDKFGYSGVADLLSGKIYLENHKDLMELINQYRHDQRNWLK